MPQRLKKSYEKLKIQVELKYLPLRPKSYLLPKQFSTVNKLCNKFELRLVF